MAKLKSCLSGTHIARTCCSIGVWTVIPLAVLLHIVAGFNLETRLPIVKQGLPGSYFGYSVAEHLTGKEIGDDKWILVGAPLGRNLQPNTTRSGALFKCPITQNLDDCEQVVTDGLREPGGRLKDPDDTELSPPTDDEEIKEDQWMGVTVRSQSIGGKVLVCAHRYIIKEKQTQHGQGLCYLLTNDLEFDDQINPCSGRTTARAHEDYGYCQAGTSGQLFPDGTMALGTPGPYTWRGTVFVQTVVGEYLGRDKSIYHGPHFEANSPVGKYSYLGMAVTGGNYFEPDQMAYASGAPRSMGHGQVVFFTKKSKIELQNNEMNVRQTLDGEQFASNFGYEMATADVNGDTLDDLLIAAPLYFKSNLVGGAVYVYLNENYKIGPAFTSKVTGQPESRFGQAIANLGDLNNDHCDDIAIGAPYEGSGVVYIYLGSKQGLSEKPAQVIRASELGLLPSPIKTFGSSLSGGLDLDDNSYPDLLVGAYESATTVALFARPITNIQTNVSTSEMRKIDPSQPGCRSDRSSNTTCFAFVTCCSIDPFEHSLGQTLELSYIIEAETFDNRKKFSRVYFALEASKKNNTLRRNIRVTVNGTMHCEEQVVYLKEGTRDIQSPIQFRLSYSIVEPPLLKSSLLGLNPILDQTQANRTFEATFQKDCGDNDECESELYVHAELELEQDTDHQYKLVLGEREEVRLNLTVTNSKESAYEAQLFVEHQPSISYIASLKGGVICNRHNVSMVVCTLGNPMQRDAAAHVTLRFDASGLDDTAPAQAFKIFANTTSKQLRPQEKTVLTVRVVKKAELTIYGAAEREQSFYGGEVKGEAAMKYLDDVGPIVQHTYQIYNLGPWRAPYVEVYIMWPHQVANDKPQGKWLLYLEDKPTVEGAGGGECDARGDVFNPLKLMKRAQPAELRMAGAEISARHSRFPIHHQENNKTLNAIGSRSESMRTLNRIRRDRSMVIRAERLINKEGKKTDIVNMDCEKSTAKCVQIKCKIYNMQRKTEAFIHVRSRLWNSTLVSDYPRVDMVNIVSYASIKIPDPYGIHQNSTNHRTWVETHAYPDLQEQTGDTSVPIWIIIVSVVGGLILLALFTFCLWKMGFFKRRRPDPTLSGNLEKNKNGENKLLLQNK